MTDNERLVAQDIDEIVWLRLKRLTSLKLCEKILSNKADQIDRDIDRTIIHNKAIGLSSSIESSINYWNFKTDSLNLRILSRYYALLQMTIAEQVSSLNNEYDLPQIQRYTEAGHGLGNLRNLNDDFPDNYFIILLKSGYVHSYAKFLGIRRKFNEMAFERRPRDYNSVDATDKNKLIPLTSLFSRIPELRPVIFEYLGINPLSFHVVYDTLKNRDIEGDKTFLNLYPENAEISEYDLSNYNLPFQSIQENENHFGVEFSHPEGVIWHQRLNLYRSNYCGTSYIVPLKNAFEDPILLNLMLLYSLSIVVRYLPNLWYEIYHGNLDHFGSLIDYYVSIFDHVIPLKMLERITENEIHLSLPGTLSSPI